MPAVRWLDESDDPGGWHVVDFALDVFPQMLTTEGIGIYGHRLVGQVLSTDTPQRYDDTCNRVASGEFILP